MFKSVHVCVIYKCKHWTLVADFSNGNQPLTGSTEYTARICMPKETQDGSHVSKGNTLLCMEPLAQPASLRCDTKRNVTHGQRIYFFVTAKMCSVLDIIPSYTGLRNRCDTKRNVTHGQRIYIFFVTAKMCSVFDIIPSYTGLRNRNEDSRRART